MARATTCGARVCRGMAGDSVSKQRNGEAGAGDDTRSGGKELSGVAPLSNGKAMLYNAAAKH